MTVFYKAGAEARPGSSCPYFWGVKRTEWLAGHFDAHGRAAWQEARIPLLTSRAEV
jgi:ribosome modulation factor